jgi:hypothetical protein
LNFHTFRKELSEKLADEEVKTSTALKKNIHTNTIRGKLSSDIFMKLDSCMW